MVEVLQETPEEPPSFAVVFCDEASLYGNIKGGLLPDFVLFGLRAVLLEGIGRLHPQCFYEDLVTTTPAP